MTQLHSIAKDDQGKFSAFVAQTEKYLDEVVIDGSDQDLFIASYFTGHFSVVASLADIKKDWSLEGLNIAILASLGSAFSQNELAEEDQEQVFALWEKLTGTIV